MKGVKGAESLTEPLEHASNKMFSVSLNLPHGMSAYVSLQAQAASSTSLLLRKHSLVHTIVQLPEPSCTTLFPGTCMKKDKCGKINKSLCLLLVKMNHALLYFFA